MGLNSRRRGQRPRIIALACGRALAAVLAAVPVTLAAPASAAPRPDPLVHAPRFQGAFGQQVLAGPGGVAADPAGGIWVADTGHDRVAEFTASGRLVTTIGRGLDHPAGVAADAAGHVWVADAGHDRVVEFSSAGRVLASFGSAGGGHGQLDWALAATLENPPHGSLRDIEHIVILMQKNRSFSTMPGVRGFADPAAIRPPDGGQCSASRTRATPRANWPGTTARWTRGYRPRGSSPRGCELLAD